MQYHLEINNVKVPVQIKASSKNVVRYSISRTSANLSVPKYYFGHIINKEKKKFEQWCHMQFENKPELLLRFKSKIYATGDILTIMGKEYTLSIIASDRKSISTKIFSTGKVIASIPNITDEKLLHSRIGKSLSRSFSQFYLKNITQRVHAINNRYFNEKIETIRLKNNSSNWGSCSAKKNINLSSRLLFAPQIVIDYVIVHELSHLKEMNHSTKFWSIVSSVMPEYKKCEKWLKINGHRLRF